MSYDLRWYVDIICWESDILFVWSIINGQTFDCYMNTMKLYKAILMWPYSQSYIIFDEIRQ